MQNAKIVWTVKTNVGKKGTDSPQIYKRQTSTPIVPGVRTKNRAPLVVLIAKGG